MTSNRKLGNDFESEFCEILAEHGFWVHNFALKKSGQPADVIAVKNRTASLIDCKVCENDEFPLSRIEENQRLSMELWENCGNGRGWFVLNTSKGVRITQLSDLLELGKTKKTLSLSDIIDTFLTLEEWLWWIG